MGFAENTGDELTFQIFTDHSEKIIARSMVRSAEKPDMANLRVRPTPEKIIGMKDLLPNGTLPMIEMSNLIGYDFVG